MHIVAAERWPMQVYPLVSPMADVTAAQFYKAIDEIKTFVILRLDQKTGELIGHIDSKHASLRETLTDVDDKLDAHQIYTNRIDNRVTSLESRIETEAKQAVRMTTWLALIIPTAVTAFLKWIWK